MPFFLSSKDLAAHLEPLGFTVKKEAEFDDTAYLFIEHPDHEGIVLSLVLDTDTNHIDELERRVEGGPEKELRENIDDLTDLTEEERQHVHDIDFGEIIDVDDIENMDELVSLIRDAIAVRPEL